MSFIYLNLLLWLEFLLQCWIAEVKGNLCHFPNLGGRTISLLLLSRMLDGGFLWPLFVIFWFLIRKYIWSFFSFLAWGSWYFWSFLSDERDKDVFYYSWQAPFNHTRVYVNEVTFEKPLTVGAECQRNQPGG